MNKLCKKVANRKGFTLVELIVVIAILGILAGVAIPVYSGYIERAHQAADDQAIAAVNMALAATAAANGTTPSALTVEAGTTGVTTITIGTGSDVKDVKADFDKFYEGNTFSLEYYDDVTVAHGVMSGTKNSTEGSTGGSTGG